jgi:6-pyruvoyltetrahydropterin/6-carboxytetrahydropterin synthase
VAKTASLTLRVAFSSLHELKNPAWSDTKNTEVFGKCFRTHGHDYFLEVTVKGKIDQKSGLCCDRTFLAKILQKEIVDELNGVDLNTIYKSTTGEDLARELFNKLKNRLAPLDLVGVGLQETPKNYFYFSDSQS